jgi:hypothetical protein
LQAPTNRWQCSGPNSTACSTTPISSAVRLKLRMQAPFTLSSLNTSRLYFGRKLQVQVRLSNTMRSPDQFKSQNLSTSSSTYGTVIVSLSEAVKRSLSSFYFNPSDQKRACILGLNSEGFTQTLNWLESTTRNVVAKEAFLCYFLCIGHEDCV